MVVCVGTSDHGLQADIVFVVEGTAINGAYINDLKTSYIIPALEYFAQGNIDERDYITENSNAYGIVVYQASDCLPHSSSDTFGPFTNASRLLNAFENLELIGGKGESHANIAEGLATTLQCFEELQHKREPGVPAQKHCILVCNSPPYCMPVMESYNYSGKTCEQLATILQERAINLSIISPRKMPALFKLFEKAGGDLSTSQTKNYAKDPRHLVLLKGFCLKERPISPPPGAIAAQQNQIATANLTITSLPSPLPNTDSPMSNVSQQPQNMLPTGPTGIPSSVGQPVFRPNQNQPGMQPQMPPHSQSMVPPINIGRPGGHMGNPQFSNQQLAAPPGYHPNAIGAGRPPTRWPMMPPQQRPYMQQQQNTQGSALIAQLTQPPSSMPPNQQVNQFGQMPTNTNPQLNPQAAIRIQMLNNQQQINMQQQNVQANMNQNQMQQNQINQGQMSQNQMSQSMNQNQISQNLNQNPMGQNQMGQNQMNQNQMNQNQMNQNQMNQNQMNQNQMNPNQNQNQRTNSTIVTESMTVSPPIPVVSPSPMVNQAPANTPMPASQQNLNSRERHTIWHGVLEWIEKPKNPTDQQKLTRHVPCSVSANAKDGEPELKADCWPQKLIMQLMPKQLIGNIGGVYLRNSKSVLFHPQQCEALDSLTKVMITGFAGCVHFTSVPSATACDIKVLILLYTTEKRAYLGFIPNDQAAFVDRLRKVIQQQKSNQQLVRQLTQPGQGPLTGQNVTVTLNASMGNPQTPLGQGNPNPATSQPPNSQQGIMMSQTNTMAMGGGQITQNVVTSTSQNQPNVNLLGQVNQSTMSPRMCQGMPGQPGNVQGGNAGQVGSSQQQAAAAAAAAAGMQQRPNIAMSAVGTQQQRPPFDHLEAARQQNLEKINQLKQTLEAAQQQQIEIMNHMKTQQTQQMHDALQIAPEMQYKLQMEMQQQQRQGIQPQPGPQGAGVQQRMMRPPALSSNPGLRHLLQQQPQYRQQMMGMPQMQNIGQRPQQMGQQQLPNAGNQMQQQQFDDVSSFEYNM